MDNKRIIHLVSALLAFAIPFGLFFYTHANSLGFADAAEFALVTRIASVAHGPGFPAYVFLGWLWSYITQAFISTHFLRIVLFSVVSMSAACMLLYLTAVKILQRAYAGTDSLYTSLIALFTALAFASGFTAWYWASNVEVYAFHVFTFALLVYGALGYNQTRSNLHVIITGVGLALGLSNHHLTTILFIPFLFVFVGPDLFSTPAANAKAAPKKKKTPQPASGNALILDFFKSRQFGILAGTTAGLLLFFYGWMMTRAAVSLPFKFGSPDTLERLYFHVSGGAFRDKMMKEVDGIVGMRFPYFAWLLMRQYGLYILPVAAGLVQLFIKKWYKLGITVVAYFILLQVYQLRLDQTGDSDAYMLLPYYLLALTIPFGAMWLYQLRRQAVLLLPVAFMAQALWNFPLDDKRAFDLSKSLMKTLDESAPKNSVILVADWTLVSEYYYYRIAENFRPDLVVLNYDLKFTNYNIIKIMYPDFYKLIQPEYDKFVIELANAHPQQIYNTGCDLSTNESRNAFVSALYKISAVCKQHNYPLMFDPQAFVTFSQSKLFSANVFVSGCFLSEVRTDMGHDFIKLPFKWLDMPLIKHEPGAADKIVDMEAMLDFHQRYAVANNDTVSLPVIVAAHNKIKALEAEMKENAPFLYK